MMKWMVTLFGAFVLFPVENPNLKTLSSEWVKFAGRSPITMLLLVALVLSTAFALPTTKMSTRFVKPLKREFEYSGPPSYNELFTCIKHWTLHQIDYHWGVQYHQIQWGRLCFHLLKGEEVMCNSGRRNLYVPFHLQRGQTSQLHMGGLPYALVIILRMVIMLW